MSSVTSPPLSSSSSSSLSLTDLLRVYNLDKACRRSVKMLSKRHTASCKEQPLCLHGLKSAKGPFGRDRDREGGRERDALSLRSRHKAPLVGLLNLGATCYMNTLLQCLFMNSHFRHLFYRYRSRARGGGGGKGNRAISSPSPSPSQTEKEEEKEKEKGEAPSPPLSPSLSASTDIELDADDIVSQLQLLFGWLEFGPFASVNPESIAAALGLNKHEQQDVNEFNHLFLSLLEHKLEDCADDAVDAASVRSLIKTEFMGETISTVTCHECKQKSDKTSAFLDLTLQIKDKRTVKECLDSLTATESLCGANQYWCSVCRKKCNAERCTRLILLPPVLNLQLTRFAYDVESGTRRKVSSKIFIPYQLDLRPYLHPKSDSEALYELTAVLRHKGQSAHRGHYTAEIRDTQGKWWMFDDERVALIGDRFNAKGDSVTAPRQVTKAGTDKKDGQVNRKPAATKRKPKSVTSISDHKRKKISTVKEDVNQVKIDTIFTSTAPTNPSVHKLKSSSNLTTIPTAYNLKSSSKSPISTTVASTVPHDDVTSTPNSKKKAKTVELLVEEDEQSVAVSCADSSSENSVIEEVPPHLDLGDASADIINLSKGGLSANAYMLVYTLRSRLLRDDECSRKQRAEVEPDSTDTSSSSVSSSSFAHSAGARYRCLTNDQCKLPFFVQQHINQAVLQQQRELQSLRQSEDQLLALVSQRRDRIANFEEHAESFAKDVLTNPKHKIEELRHLDSFYFVHTAWLMRWMSGMTEADFSDEQALHSWLPLSSSKAAVALELSSPSVDTTEQESYYSNEASKQPVDRDQDPDCIEIDQPISDDDKSYGISQEKQVHTSPVSAPFSSCITKECVAVPLWPGDIWQSIAKLRCEHGLLSPSLPALLSTSCVSEEAWEILIMDQNESREQWQKVQKDAGVPAEVIHSHLKLVEERKPLCGVQALCPLCGSQRILDTEACNSQKQSIDAVLEAMKPFTTWHSKCAENSFCLGDSAERGYWVSRSWYKGLRDAMNKFKQKSVANAADSTASSSFPPLAASLARGQVNDDLRCAHGNWRADIHEIGYLVPPAVWIQLLTLCPSAIALSNTEGLCPICRKQSNDDTAERSKIADLLSTEQSQSSGLRSFLKQSHHESFPDEKKPPARAKKSCTNILFLLPASWVNNAFLPYQQQVRVNDKAPIMKKPDPVQVRDRLLCKDHQQLQYHPFPRSLLNQDDPFPGLEPGVLTYCDEAAWSNLCDLGYASKEDAVTMTVQSQLGNGLVGFSSNEWHTLQLDFRPPLCRDCLKSTRAQDRHRMFSYDNGTIKILRIDLDAPLNVTKDTYEASERTRRKCRMVVKETILVMKVNASVKVSTFKLMMMEHCDHNQASMMLFYNGTELMDEKTLSDYHVPNGGELYLKVDNTRVGSDFTDLSFDDIKFLSSDGIENGFAGTKLTGGPAQNKVTSHVMKTRVDLASSPPPSASGFEFKVEHRNVEQFDVTE